MAKKVRRNLSEGKKTHPEHKYSVTFVSKVGTITGKKQLLNNNITRPNWVICEL